MGGSVLLKETRGPEEVQMHHCGCIFFRMFLGRHFLQKLMTLGLHWGPFGRPWGAFFCNFCNVFSGSDFRLILDMLLVRVGGRGVSLLNIYIYMYRTVDISDLSKGNLIDN